MLIRSGVRQRRLVRNGRGIDGYRYLVHDALGAAVVGDHEREGVASGSEVERRAHDVCRVRGAGPCPVDDLTVGIARGAPVQLHLHAARTRVGCQRLIGPGLRDRSLIRRRRRAGVLRGAISGRLPHIHLDSTAAAREHQHAARNRGRAILGDAPKGTIGLRVDADPPCLVIGVEDGDRRIFVAGPLHHETLQVRPPDRPTHGEVSVVRPVIVVA